MLRILKQFLNFIFSFLTAFAIVGCVCFMLFSFVRTASYCSNVLMLKKYCNTPISFEASSEKKYAEKRYNVKNIDDFKLEDSYGYDFGVFIYNPNDDETESSEEISLGHAFLVLRGVRKDNPKDTMVFSVGFYPAKSLTLKDFLLSKNVAGELKSDINQDYTNFKVLKVSKNRASQILKAIKKKKALINSGKLQYNPEKYNSANFVDDITKECSLIKFVWEEGRWTSDEIYLKNPEKYKRVINIMRFKKGLNPIKMSKTINEKSYSEKTDEWLPKMIRGLE